MSNEPSLMNASSLRTLAAANALRGLFRVVGDLETPCGSKRTHRPGVAETLGFFYAHFAGG